MEDYSVPEPERSDTRSIEGTSSYDSSLYRPFRSDTHTSSAQEALRAQKYKHGKKIVRRVLTSALLVACKDLIDGRYMLAVVLFLTSFCACFTSEFVL